MYDLFLLDFQEVAHLVPIAVENPTDCVILYVPGTSQYERKRAAHASLSWEAESWSRRIRGKPHIPPKETREQELLRESRCRARTSRVVQAPSRPRREPTAAE